MATSSKKRVEGDSLLYCSDGHLLNIPVNNRWKQGEWWYNRELQISEQDNRMIYVDEHGYLCITELYAENIIIPNALTAILKTVPCINIFTTLITIRTTSPASKVLPSPT